MIPFTEKCDIVYNALQVCLKENGRVLVSIDGRCAAGKTTLAEALRTRFENEHISCVVFHMDSFFLRPEQRSSVRLSTPGENVDHERFLTEVLLPLKAGKSVIYRPFDCKAQILHPPVVVPDADVVIVEGSYSCHQKLRDYYDIRIFLDVEKEEQIRRIRTRNGQGASLFFTKWIPLEEAYFDTCEVKTACELTLL